MYALTRGKHRPTSIPFGHDHDGFRPLDPKSWIVPSESTRARWRIELRHVVRHFGIVFERQEPVGKPFGNIEHPTIFSRQRHADMMAICRRCRPQIDDHIVNRSPRAPYKFHFFVWGDLKMHPSQGPSAFAYGDIALNP